MKFLLDFMTCYGSCSSEVRRPPGEESRMLMVQEHRHPVGRKRGRVKERHEWRPRLSSISEDNVMTAQRANSIETPVAAARWRRSLKRNVSSTSEKERNRGLHRVQAW
ncbi:hypothetical protein F511_21591 [Dorcoceras hygrometricum]|uniref:Uncharacterized protein n=1 Tax=Dorcoceras hygrometricum TaxID=472368 RepID=A0A2Z7DF13_9LAMI|nr:hypothetical protein F511_21591 [Dorcoceras hygrometricum]